MAIAFAEAQTGTQTGGGTSVVSASLGAGGADSLYIAYICTRSNVDVTGVTGLGLTWNSYGEQCGARAQGRIEQWYAYGAGTAGAVTAAHAACNTSVIGVCRYTGVDSGTPVDEKYGWNTLGNGGACTGGTDNDDCTGTFTVSHNDVLVVAGFNTRNRAMSATSGWNVRIDDVGAGSGGDIQALTVEDKAVASSGDITMGAANNLSGTADWCLYGIEVHTAAAAAGAVPNALMMMGVGT